MAGRGMTHRQSRSIDPDRSELLSSIPRLRPARPTPTMPAPDQASSDEASPSDHHRLQPTRRSTFACPAGFPSPHSRGSPSIVSSEPDSTLVTLTPSLQADLFQTTAGGIRMQALNDDYKWPAESHAVRSELLASKIMELLYEDTGMYYEPRKGQLADLLGEEGSKMLDMGSGVTASWAISMAERFPACQVFGLDLVPCELSYLPRNVSLEIWDLLNGLPFPDNHFALIHSRGTRSSGFFQQASGSANILNEVVRCLRPGGVLILEEADNIVGSDDPTSPHLALLQAQVSLHIERFAGGKPNQQRLLLWPREMAAHVKATAGFKTVIAKSFTAPVGAKESVSDSEAVLRALAREAWLLHLEMSRLGACRAEEDAITAKEAEERAIPAEDVGLHATVRVVWAEKEHVEGKT